MKVAASLYLDTSCLLKLLLPEPESSRVVEILSLEEHVVVSSLARLEALVQVQARLVAGQLKRSTAKSLVARMESILGQSPYELMPAPSGIVETAGHQVGALPKDGYCPTLDRLHLAVMQTLGLDRLLTNDGAQARAARSLGFNVILPQ